MTIMTKKTLTLATLMLMTSGGTWAGTSELRVGNRAIYQNNPSKLTRGMTDLDDGYFSGDESTDSTRFPQDFAPKNRQLQPTRKAPSPPALQAARETDALEEAAKKKEASKIKAAQEKAALEEAAKKKEAQEKADAKKEALLKKTSEQKVKKELDHFIQGPGFFEKITQRIWKKKDSQNQILASDIYEVFTDYLMENKTITEKGMTELLFPKIENLNAYEQEAWKKIIETDARAITSKWVYEGNKNFTPKNAAVYAVRLSLLKDIVLDIDQEKFNNPYMENFKKILFQGHGHKNFRKHLINELKKQIQKNDTLWQYFLDIHPELKPETSKDRQNLETFNDIMCNAGTKIFVGFSPKQNKPSKKQQWAEALLQSETYKPTMIQRIFRRLTPLENILIQSMVDLAKNDSISKLNDRILWLSGLKGDKIDSLKNDKIDNILGNLYKKIHAYNKGQVLSKISTNAREALDNVPDVKKGMKSKS